MVELVPEALFKKLNNWTEDDGKKSRQVKSSIRNQYLSVFWSIMLILLRDELFWLVDVKV